MLKGTFKNSYRNPKTGNFTVVYGVTGTVAELAQFAQAKADAQGISLEDYHAKREANGGQHVHHVTPNAAMGITAEKTCNLVITPNGKVVVDNSDKQLAEINEDSAQIRAARNQTIGTIQAEIQLGLRGRGARAASMGGGNVTTSAPATTGNAGNEETPAVDEFNDVQNQLQNNGAQVGNENLADQQLAGAGQPQ